MTDLTKAIFPTWESKHPFQVPSLFSTFFFKKEKDFSLLQHKNKGLPR